MIIYRYHLSRMTLYIICCNFYEKHYTVPWYNKYKQTLLDISFCIWVTRPDVIFFSFLALSNSIFSWLVSLFSVSKTDTGETGWWSCNRLSWKLSKQQIINYIKTHNLSHNHNFVDKQLEAFSNRNI